MFKKIFYSVVRVLFNGLFFGIYGLHVETVNAEEESVEKHSHHAVKYLFKHLPA